MEFKTDRPIYRQIAEFCFARILSGAWREGEKVPSVREMSVDMSVNTHTVLKAYDYLQLHGIIEPRRGMGYFLAEDARIKVNTTRKEDFFTVSAPELFEQMELLGITETDLIESYRLFRKKKNETITPEQPS
ncbi:MAG: GntR family transcriptional regulator [Paramuribaculum sp.]|nr:GntR family transcriptional regulator [Paramuribaculum sp.]